MPTLLFATTYYFSNQLTIYSWMPPAFVTAVALLIVAGIARSENVSIRKISRPGPFGGIFTAIATITAICTILAAWGIWWTTTILTN